MTQLKTKAEFIYFFANGQADSGSEIRHLVGGKGASLADLTKAGFNVPPGFTISAECCDFYFRHGKKWPPGLEDEIRTSLAQLETIAGRKFGGGDKPLMVAVRSGAAESMPGMMDTILNVGSWDQLVTAINAVFDSWNNDRAFAYRDHHQIKGLLGTAVTIQMMCPAEVSGVMFTANPVSLNRDQILVESIFGLGEALVLGKVTPDRFTINRQNVSVIDQAVQNPNGPLSLSDSQLRELVDLGTRVEDHFQIPCDIEWALSEGKFYLLQSRPIKGFTRRACPAGQAPRLNEEELEIIRQEEIAILAAKAEPQGTVWSRYNLSEILPAPTPMTWAIVRRFMSGHGGFGLMYRDLGFDPDPALDEKGIFDLVAGRPYCNLSREPRMQYRYLPFEHSFDALKANPSRALYPQPTLNPARAPLRFWLMLPWLLLKLSFSAGKLKKLSQTCAVKLRQDIFPSFAAETAQEMSQDLAPIESSALLDRLEFWIRRTLYDFGRDSLKPTVLAAVAMGNLERGLRKLGPERTRSALGELTLGVRPDPEADLPGAISDLAAGRIDREAFLQRFGHRGSQEMELSQPRWRENPETPSQLASQTHEMHLVNFDMSSFDLIAEETPIAAGLQTALAAQRIAAEAHLSTAQRTVLAPQLELLRTYLRLRETAKHYLMMGYTLIRRILVELDRRHRLDGNIFFLTPEELPRLIVGEDVSTMISQRRRRRELLLSLPVPQVLFSDDLEAIGRAVSQVDADSFQGVPLSAGVAEGPALVLIDPTAAEAPHEPYVLVCPSTDPAWVSLFANAQGLVMETGGVMSHGAIVAREFGLPAVAGVPDIHRRIKTGQRIRVDGGTGKVSILG
jgi:pyruvate,water dikinase